MDMVIDRVADRSRFAAMSDEEARIRRDLAAAYRLVALFGWDDMLATHLSAKIVEPDGQETFLINPLGLMFEEVTASSLIKINLAGEILQDTPYKVNRAGFVIHSAVHAARPDAGCVIHLHSLDGVAVSTMEEGLLPLNQSAMIIASQIAYHDYEGLANDEAERERLVADLGDKRHMLLRNHGTLAIGRTVGAAFALMHVLEWCCTVQVRTLGMGRELRQGTPAVLAKMNGIMGNPNLNDYADTLTWPALLRKLDRSNPGYAD